MKVYSSEEGLHIILESKHEAKRMLDILKIPMDTTQEEVFAKDLLELIRDVLAKESFELVKKAISDV